MTTKGFSCHLWTRSKGCHVQPFPRPWSKMTQLSGTSGLSMRIRSGYDLMESTFNHFQSMGRSGDQSKVAFAANICQLKSQLTNAGHQPAANSSKIDHLKRLSEWSPKFLLKRPFTICYWAACWATCGTTHTSHSDAVKRDNRRFHILRGWPEEWLQQEGVVWSPAVREPWIEGALQKSSNHGCNRPWQRDKLWRQVRDLAIKYVKSGITI